MEILNSSSVELSPENSKRRPYCKPVSFSPAPTVPTITDKSLPPMNRRHYLQSRVDIDRRDGIRADAGVDRVIRGNPK